MALRLPRRAAVLAALCVLCAPILTGAFELSASERVAAERIAELAQTDEGIATLQQLLSTNAMNHDTQPLSGVGRGTFKAEAYGGEEEELLEEELTAVDSKQGKGFKLAFYPKNSTVFDPMKSKSFRVVPKQMFLLGYADNTHLKGFQGRDVVQLGDFFVDTKFGSITDCNSPDFNNVDGIMGFGMPVQHQAAPPPPSGLGAMMGGGGGGGSGAPPVVLPLPLLFGLTDPAVKDSANNHVLSRRAFSFMSTDNAAEIQLGGSLSFPLSLLRSLSTSFSLSLMLARALPPSLPVSLYHFLYLSLFLPPFLLPYLLLSTVLSLATPPPHPKG